MGNKGFVFVETMIVTTVLIASLLLIYFSYQGLINKYNKSIRYDDPAFLYKTAVFKDFLVNLRDENGKLLLNSITKKLSEKEQSLQLFYINSQANELFGKNMNYYQTKKSFFSNLYNGYNVNSMYLINTNIIKNIENYSSKYTNIKEEEKMYLKTLGGASSNKWFLIVIYSEKLNGEGCKVNDKKVYNTKSLTEKSCIYYYTSLELAE